MAALDTRLRAIEEKLQPETFEIVRLGADGVARDSNGKPLAPGRENGCSVITIVRSYGVKHGNT
ncbi:hypothetical protein [Propionivibrio sp.]|uniref:hypothetical protein n=1 Tax=Propionivibrio sp. TaxID=2212460 RepID=UPI003BF3570B